MNDDIKMTGAIFNMEQINYYCENGAVVRHVGIKYYEDTGKMLFYVQYEMNEKYIELKDIWMGFRR